MCPNCPISMAGMNGGQWAAIILIVFFFVAGVAALIWAYKQGLFKNIEEAKYRMLEEDLSSEARGAKGGPKK